MIKITLITVGTLKEDYLISAQKEYVKRLAAFADFEEINLKEEKINDEDNAREVLAALESEGEKILSKIPEGAYKIALCVEGKQLSSEDFAAAVSECTDRNGKLCLIIGSSHGLSDKVKGTANLRLSISKMTFPHQLMRVFTIEQLYRALTIINNKKYHK